MSRANRFPPKTVLTREQFHDAAQNARVEFAVNEFGRDGLPLLEQIRKELWELADTMTEHCDSRWVIATRAEVARRVREIADRLKPLARNQPTQPRGGGEGE